MDRESEQRLIDFMCSQYQSFDAESWLACAADFPKDVLAAAALFMGGSYWMGNGNEDALYSVAEKLLPDSVGHFSELVQRTKFDCSKFGNTLNERLRK